jgi:hypothetical protein
MIRPKVYRGKEGFLVSGTNTGGQHVSIHTYSRASADLIKAKLARDEMLEAPDYF